MTTVAFMFIAALTTWVVFIAIHDPFSEVASAQHLLQLHVLAVDMEEHAAAGRLDKNGEFYKFFHHTAELFGRGCPDHLPGTFEFLYLAHRAGQAEDSYPRIKVTTALEHQIERVWRANLFAAIRYRSFPLFALGKAMDLFDTLRGVGFEMHGFWRRLLDLTAARVEARELTDAMRPRMS